MVPLPHRAVSALALWLGLAALMIQGLAPLCLTGAMAATRDGGTTIVICTIHGPETIRVGGDGTTPPTGSAHDGSDCALCAAFHNVNAFTHTAPVLMQLSTAPREISLSRVAPMFIARVHLPYATRAPPVSTETVTV